MTQNTKSTSNTSPQATEQRREPRIALSIEIEVNGIDRAGHPFCVITKTSEVSEWGCSFYLPFELSADVIVSLSVVGEQRYCLPKTQPVIFQIMSSRRDSCGWLLGASKGQPERLWNVDAANFPSAG